MFWKTIGSMLMYMFDAISLVGSPFLIWFCLSEMESNSGWRAFLYGIGGALLFALWLFSWIVDGYDKVGTWFW